MVSSAIGRNPFDSVVPDAVTRALVKLYIFFENTGLSRLKEYFFYHYPAITIFTKGY
jgi:hypothetical protein